MLLMLPLLAGCPNGGPTIDVPDIDSLPTETADSVDDLAFRLFMDLEQSQTEGYEAPTAGEADLFAAAVAGVLAGERDRTDFVGLGYDLTRLQEDGGDYLVMREIQSRGRAAVIFDPSATKDLIVQTPHIGFDTDTWEQGAAVFQTLGARALVLNGAHRCANEAPSGCDGTSPACGDPDWFRESDAAHFDTNNFQAATKALDEAYPTAVFVQLHGFGWDGSEPVAYVSDGTEGDADEANIANVFKAALLEQVPEGYDVSSCNDPTDAENLCGTTNVQGRYLNGEDATCNTAASTSSERFLHVEQALDLRRPDGEMLHRGQIIEALRQTLAN